MLHIPRMSATTPADTRDADTRDLDTRDLDTRDADTRTRNLVLVMLVIAYTFNFLDRQILGILKEPIKQELQLTDTQLGLMGGLAFALLYSTLSVPIAWLADRVSRVSIMSWSLALFSGFTMLCGMATGYWSLFLPRVGVGIGEAGGAAPAYSLLADYFPKAQRARVLAVFSMGIPLGSGLGLLFGGLIAAYVSWRWSFLVVGGAGLLLAPVLRRVVKDPVRGGMDGAMSATQRATPSPRFMDVVRTLLPKRTFWLLALGAASSSICGYGVAFWLPSFFIRSLGLTLAETSIYYGTITLIGGSLGLWFGGALADRYAAKSRRAYPLVPAIAFLIGLPCFFTAMNVQSLVVAYVLFLIPTGLNLAWLGPVLTAVQHLVPVRMRSTASALFLLVNNLLGIAVGLWIFGFLSDKLAPTYGAESMRYAIYCGLGFYVVSSTLLWLASRRLPQDWVEA